MIPSWAWARRNVAELISLDLAFPRIYLDQSVDPEPPA